MPSNENQRIHIQKGLEELKNSNLIEAYSKVIVLCDSNTHKSCLPLLSSTVFSSPPQTIEIPAGESQKDIEVATKLWTRLNDLGADRNTILINLGGGVVCDLGGFVASTFKRGIDFINIPTTMLAMVDAAIGGKTGINLHHVKNQVGTFAFPKSTIIEPKFLDTLPKTEILSGFAETIKHALIADVSFWNEISVIDHIDNNSTKPTIFTSATIKTNIAEKDIHEKGLRKTLNFGHTVGHGLESWFIENGTPIPHGFAVALGITLEVLIASRNFQLKDLQADQIINFISKHYDLSILKGVDYSQVWHWMEFDKKNVGKSVRASLVNNIGSCDFNIEIQKEMLLNAAKELN